MEHAYHRRVAPPNMLGNSTSGRLQNVSPVVVIPVGSIEQHGPHLPLDTDTRIATAVAGAVVEELAGGSDVLALLGPAIAYGASGEHEAFPGTISIGADALEHLLLEFGRSAMSWANRLMFVNGHGGNVGALAAAVATLRYENRDVGWCPCAVCGGDAHAGHTETSVLLHLSPGDVLMAESRPGNTAALADLMSSMRCGGVAAVSEVGVLGDPTTASAGAGARLFAEMVGGVLDRFSRWAPGADGMLR
jgi:mycofactocin system creatininase family protein